jgi:hypothetical protein
MKSDFLDDALAVLRAATLLGGDLEKATSWFFADRIDVFEGQRRPPRHSFSKVERTTF